MKRQSAAISLAHPGTRVAGQPRDLLQVSPSGRRRRLLLGPVGCNFVLPLGTGEPGWRQSCSRARTPHVPCSQDGFCLGAPPPVPQSGSVHSLLADSGKQTCGGPLLARAGVQHAGVQVSPGSLAPRGGCLLHARVAKRAWEGGGVKGRRRRRRQLLLLHSYLCCLPLS